MVGTSVQLADPLVCRITRLWHEDLAQVTEHSAVPPVVLVILIYEGCHHLQQDRKHLDTSFATKHAATFALITNQCTYIRAIRPLPHSWMFRVSLIEAHPEPAALCSTEKEEQRTQCNILLTSG